MFDNYPQPPLTRSEKVTLFFVGALIVGAILMLFCAGCSHLGNDPFHLAT